MAFTFLTMNHSDRTSATVPAATHAEPCPCPRPCVVSASSPALSLGFFLPGYVHVLPPFPDPCPKPQVLGMVEGRLCLVLSHGTMSHCTMRHASCVIITLKLATCIEAPLLKPSLVKSVIRFYPNHMRLIHTNMSHGIQTDH